MALKPALCRRHRLPAEIISDAVWLDFRFILSHRDVEDALYMAALRNGLSMTMASARPGPSSAAALAQAWSSPSICRGPWL